MRTHAVGVVAAVVLAIGLSTVPAHATVHEIVAQWYSGHDELGPPGISDDEKKNFAQPLNATRVVIRIVNEATQTVLITFAYDHPAVKVQSSGLTIPIGIAEETGFPRLLDVPEPNPDFPASATAPRSVLVQRGKGKRQNDVSPLFPFPISPSLLPFADAPRSIRMRFGD